MKRKSSLAASDTKEENGIATEISMKRTLGLDGCISFIVGSIIGSGIFISPKGVLSGAGSVGMALVIWAGGGLISMIGAICYIELGTMYGKSGGEYAYLKKSYHPVVAYLYSAVNLFLIRPSSLAAIAMTCSQYLTVMFFDDGCGDPPDFIMKCLSAIIILTVGGINYVSVKSAVNVQIIFTYTKVFALIVIIIGGFVKIAQGYTEYLENAFEWYDKPATVGSVALGFYSSMWAYDGWNTVNIVTEEVKNPSRNLPLAIIIGVPCVTIIYILANVSYFTVLSPQELLASPAVAVSWADYVMPNFAWLLPLFVACSTFGACNSNVFTYSRLMFVTSREGHMMKVLSYIHAWNYTPAPAILICCSLGLIFMMLSTIQTIIDYVMFTVWIFYLLVFLGVLVLRYKYPDIHRPFKVPIILPIIAIIVSAYLVFAPIIEDPQLAYFLALGVFAIALILYVPFIHLKWNIPGIYMFNKTLQLFLQIVPPKQFSEIDFYEDSDMESSLHDNNDSKDIFQTKL